MFFVGSFVIGDYPYSNKGPKKSPNRCSLFYALVRGAVIFPWDQTDAGKASVSISRSSSDENKHDELD